MIVFAPPRTPHYMPSLGQDLIAHDAEQILHHSSIPSLQKSNWSEAPKFTFYGEGVTYEKDAERVIYPIGRSMHPCWIFHQARPRCLFLAQNSVN